MPANCFPAVPSLDFIVLWFKFDTSVQTVSPNVLSGPSVQIILWEMLLYVMVQSSGTTFFISGMLKIFWHKFAQVGSEEFCQSISLAAFLCQLLTVYFCLILCFPSRLLPPLQFSTPLTAEAPGGALRTPIRACRTLAQLRRWRSANYEVERGNEGTRGGKEQKKEFDIRFSLFILTQRLYDEQATDKENVNIYIWQKVFHFLILNV